jgi:hypothetical protein
MTPICLSQSVPLLLYFGWRLLKSYIDLPVRQSRSSEHLGLLTSKIEMSGFHLVFKLLNEGLNLCGAAVVFLVEISVVGRLVNEV